MHSTQSYALIYGLFNDTQSSAFLVFPIGVTTNGKCRHCPQHRVVTKLRPSLHFLEHALYLKTFHMSGRDVKKIQRNVKICQLTLGSQFQQTPNIITSRDFKSRNTSHTPIMGAYCMTQHKHQTTLSPAQKRTASFVQTVRCPGWDLNPVRSTCANHLPSTGSHQDSPDENRLYATRLLAQNNENRKRPRRIRTRDPRIRAV